MLIFRNDPVGLPGLAVIAAGFFLFLFLLALIVTRHRAGGSDHSEPNRAPFSWIGLVGQGVGIAFVGTGTARVIIDPLSPLALIEAGAVALLTGSAIGLFHWSSRIMGKNWSLVARTRSDHQLVTTGPFGLMRHPIYTALFLFMLAMALALGSTTRLLVGVPLYALGTWIRIRHEERLLREMFGTAYTGYAKRVKRFVPGIF